MCFLGNAVSSRSPLFLRFSTIVQLNMRFTSHTHPPPPRNLTDESEIISFLQHGTLVGLLPVPHPILIRKYQVSKGSAG